MLQACTPMDLSKGVTMEEFAHLSACNFLEVQTRYATGEQNDADTFRQEVRRVCCDQSGGSRIVTAFSRARLGQTGSGHYSPIGAYHEESDSVLIMDVARFKYPPYWVPLERLWSAMEEADPMTSAPRGFFILSRQEISESGEMHSCGHRTGLSSLSESVSQRESASLQCTGALSHIQAQPETILNINREADITNVLSHWLKTQPDAAERVFKRLKIVASEVAMSRSDVANPQDST